MAKSLQQSLESLRVKSRMLLDRYYELANAKRQADQQIAELQQQAQQRDTEIRALRQQIEQLRVASVLSPDHRDVEAARAFLSDLVREIDKSIAQLTQ